MRAALYWVPSLDDPLYAAGVAWLGRDAETGASVPQPALTGLNDLTADARRYGFHATLRPPMRLAASYAHFRAAAFDVARACTSFVLPPLEVENIGGFLALREREPCPALQDLCDRCVMATEPHRLAPDEAELARRRAAGLSARQEALLQRFGYPYVLDQWFFHMTLTRRLDGESARRVADDAKRHFGASLRARRLVRDICICTQDRDDFLIAERIALAQAG